MIRLSPLRYPGGKAQLGEFLGEVISSNGLHDGHYIEPYAGGAAVAIALLTGEYVSTVHINDIDPGVHTFWTAVLESTADFCALIRKTPLNMREWRRQRRVFQSGSEAGALAYGFSMFYLNRTNRSGILNGGVIGGKKQTGEWRIDARFNRDDLIDRVKRIARYKSRIHVTNHDAAVLLKQISTKRSFLYLDPPYYEKGQHLYTNYYHHDDHALIANLIQEIDQPWIVSYDEHPKVKKLYRGFRRTRYSLQYSARHRRRGSEVMFFSPDLVIPRGIL